MSLVKCKIVIVDPYHLHDLLNNKTNIEKDIEELFKEINADDIISIKSIKSVEHIDRKSLPVSNYNVFCVFYMDKS